MTQFEILILTLVFVIAILEGAQVLLKTSIYMVLRKITEEGKKNVGEQEYH